MDQSEDVGLLIKMITECIDKIANQNLRQIGLTLSQGRILMFLQARKNIKTSQKDIEDFFDVSHPTVIGILERLESKGFITSEFDSKDKRVKNIYLVPEKEASVYDLLSDFRKTMEQRLLMGLTDGQVTDLRSSLSAILNNLQK